MRLLSFKEMEELTCNMWRIFVCAGAGLITGGLSPPFGKLMGEEQQLEGDYRHLHARLRTHSESIAFYGGQDREVSP